MADFDLTQTDAQVQSILNDGQNMQGAGAQTTLTTESVLLKDVNGNYHKILKSSFTEAIRDTLAGLLVNNDKGTTINQIAAIASGDFGSITPANLASVLGGLKSIDLSSSSLSDFNDLPTTEKLSLMFCTVDSNTLNKPFASLNGGCLVISLNTTMSGVNYSYQAMTDSGKFCIRKKWTTGWTSWIVIPNS